MKEADVKQQIVDYLRYTGWLVLKMPPSIYSTKGIPDLYCLKKKRSLWLEVKGSKGKITYEQRMLGNEIIKNGGEWSLVMSVEDVIKVIGCTQNVYTCTQNVYTPK